VGVEDRRYALYHVSFGEFLTSRANEDCIDAGKQHHRIVEHYRKRCGGDWPRLLGEPYFRQHLTAHLAGAGQRGLLYGLINPSWMAAKVKVTGSHRAFAEDVERAL